MLEIKDQDLTALQAILDAMYACNAAESHHLQIQRGGTFGLVHDAFIDAATHLFDNEVATRLMGYCVNNGENVAYNLNILRDELCGVCKQWIEDNHCPECGTCVGDKHAVDCSELTCLGHESVDAAHFGVSAYWNGACRPQVFEGYKN